MDRLINENAVLSAIGEWIAHKEHTYTNATEYLRNRIEAIKTTEQEPCEDCISRKAAILEIQRHGVGCFDSDDFNPEQAERFVINRLNSLQPVKPKSKTGQ